MVKPIETIYKDYRFRSRLEARWAVFFDTLDVKYIYEKEGYDLGEFGWYLPDFWMPHYPDSDIDDGKTGIFVEIKPVKATEREYAMAFALAEQSGQNVFLFQGQPYQGEYTVTQIQFWDLGRLDPPIVMQDLQFKEWVDVLPIPGFPNYPLIDHSIRLGNEDGWAGGFVVPPLYEKRLSNLQAAYRAARQARFEHKH
jgi:hypothetical protein